MNYTRPAKTVVSAYATGKPKTFNELIKNHAKAEKAKATRAAKKK